MLFLRRLLPFLVGCLTALCLWAQTQNAGSYPWMALVAPIAFLAAGIFIGWKRFPFLDLLARIVPPAVTLAALVFGLLLAEGGMGLWAIPIVGGIISFVALELLFLLAFLPTRYPVNGLSHLNLVLVPVALWLISYASVGLTMFIHASRAIPILVLSAAGALLFWSTSHVEATPGHRRRWGAVGAWMGAHLGLLGAFLPLAIALHGAYAALLGTFALRVRRYGIAPHLPRSLIIAEILGAAVLLGGMLGTARWV